MPHAHPSTMRPLSEHAIPEKLGISREKILLPTHLAQKIPAHVNLEISKLRLACGRAYHAMRKLDDLRQHRYAGLCPSTDILGMKRHLRSLSRLRNWKEDHIPDDPTLAPSMKIPREVMYLRCNEQAYEQWGRSYDRRLYGYLVGPFKEYKAATREFAAALKTARNIELIQEVDYHELTMFQQGFRQEMAGWECFIPKLRRPSFKQLVKEIHSAVLDSVEDGELLFYKFYPAADPHKRVYPAPDSCEPVYPDGAACLSHCGHVCCAK
ncbi:uncharacterized protein BJX67DRAFT_376427 [Aspergillus lucknowensis]|uniref:Uncharacterized protein n=1 Tax=Aspergillus lucknowensis TaxID=176173 RepID=A0ABR4M7P4_9EURO